MVPHSADDLESLLVQSQLVFPEEIAACRRELTTNSAKELMAILERRQLLTPLQSQRIRKGDVDGLVLGGCKLLYRNAAGSFARVYRGSRVDDGRMIGIKVLRERWNADPSTVRLFLREGDIGKRLKHPNIVPIYETGEQGRYKFITMEFVEGGNLRDFLKIRRKLDSVEACRYGLDMVRGLEYALQQGVTHRDLKLTNVLMSSQGVAKLIDFGLAADDAMLRREDGPDLAVALEYSTLERGSDAPQNDPRSDLFFLGTILYELLTGEEPYPRTSDREERKRFSRYRDIRPISSHLPRLSFRVCQLVDRLLQVNPALRHQSAGEVVVELESILRELGHEPTVPASRPAKRTSQTVLCVEDRPKMQDVLRDYLSKHGYRVLLLSDPERALTRIKNNPPDMVVFFADSSGERVAEDFKQALSLGQTKGMGAVVVVGRSQRDLVESLGTLSDRGKVLTQPIQLRELRMALESLSHPAPSVGH
ncbi:MAG: protein kinase [Planctomycetaceae bacterium]|nr:protein kinase [Planctomycetaceae bacterium]